MREPRFFVLGVVFMCLAGCAPAVSTTAQAPDDRKERLVGRWNMTTSDLPAGWAAEFTKESRATFTGPQSDGKPTLLVVELGTYEVNGDKLTTTNKAAGRDETETAQSTWTIKAFTDKEVVLVGDGGQKIVLSRKP